jgi:hypothetical protein
MALTVTDVVTSFGAYYKPGSDNQKNLRNMIYKAGETASFFSNRPTSDTIWRGTFATLNRVVQAFQKAWTPIGTTTFKPNQFDLFKLKIDMQETPDDLEPTYLGFLADMEELDRSKWPFSRWMVENHIMPKKQEDLETAEYFAGEYVVPTPGTAGNAGESMDGLHKIIVDYNTAGRTNLTNGAISTGAPAASAEDWCTQVEEFAAAIPSQFRKKIDYIFMSLDLELKYKQGKRAKYGKDINFLDANSVSGMSTIEDYPNIKVKGLESMDGSDLIWATIPLNRIRPIKKASLADTMLVQQFAPRVVSLYTDWWEALNFEVPEFLFHNDQLS